MGLYRQGGEVREEVIVDEMIADLICHQVDRSAFAMKFDSLKTKQVN